MASVQSLFEILMRIQASGVQTTLNSIKKDIQGVGTAAKEAGDKATAAGQKMQTAWSQFAETARAAGQRMADLGAKMTWIVSIPLAGAAANAVKTFAEFERQMFRTEKLVGITSDRLSEWEPKLRAIGRETGRGPRELADALFWITSAGQRGSEALDILEQSAKGAAVGLGSTKEIAKTVTAAMNAYGKENLSAAQAMEVLFKTVREGNLEAEGLSKALGQVIGVAKLAGASFADVGASVATFTRLGVDVRMAAIGVRQSLVQLLRPGRETAKMWDLLGTTAAGFRRKISDIGLGPALVELAQNLKALGPAGEEALARLFPNVRALASVLGTAGTQAETFIQIYNTMMADMGLLDDAFERVSETTKFSLDRMSAAFEDLMVSLGEALAPFVIDILIPALMSLIDALNLVAKVLTYLPGPLKYLVGGFTALFIAIGPVLYITGMLVQTVSLLSIAVGGQLIAKLTGVAASFWTWVTSAKAASGAVQLMLPGMEATKKASTGLAAALDYLGVSASGLVSFALKAAGWAALIGMLYEGGKATLAWADDLKVLAKSTEQTTSATSMFTKALSYIAFPPAAVILNISEGLLLLRNRLSAISPAFKEAFDKAEEIMVKTFKVITEGTVGAAFITLKKALGGLGDALDNFSRSLTAAALGERFGVWELAGKALAKILLGLTELIGGKLLRDMGLLAGWWEFLAKQIDRASFAVNLLGEFWSGTFGTIPDDLGKAQDNLEALNKLFRDGVITSYEYAEAKERLTKASLEANDAWQKELASGGLVYEEYTRIVKDRQVLIDRANKKFEEGAISVRELTQKLTEAQERYNESLGKLRGTAAYKELAELFTTLTQELEKMFSVDPSGVFTNAWDKMTKQIQFTDMEIQRLSKDMPLLGTEMGRLAVQGMMNGDAIKELAELYEKLGGDLEKDWPEMAKLYKALKEQEEQTKKTEKTLTAYQKELKKAKEAVEKFVGAPKLLAETMEAHEKANLNAAESGKLLGMTLEEVNRIVERGAGVVPELTEQRIEQARTAALAAEEEKALFDVIDAIPQSMRQMSREGNLVVAAMEALSKETGTAEQKAKAFKFSEEQLLFIIRNLPPEFDAAKRAIIEEALAMVRNQKATDDLVAAKERLDKTLRDSAQYTKEVAQAWEWYQAQLKDAASPYQDIEYATKNLGFSVEALEAHYRTFKDSMDEAEKTAFQNMIALYKLGDAFADLRKKIEDMEEAPGRLIQKMIMIEEKALSLAAKGRLLSESLADVIRLGGDVATALSWKVATEEEDFYFKKLADGLMLVAQMSVRTETLSKTYVDLTANTKSLTVATSLLYDEIEKQIEQEYILTGVRNEKLEAMRQEMQATKDLMKVRERFVQIEKDVRDRVFELKNTIPFLTKRIEEWTKAGANNNLIVHEMGDELIRAGEFARKFGIELDEPTRKLIRMAEEAKRHEELVKAWEDAWSTAMGNIVEEFASGVADMIFEGKGFSIDLQSIFKDLGKSIVKIMVTGLFSPLLQKFSEWGRDLGDQVFGWLNPDKDEWGLNGGVNTTTTSILDQIGKELGISGLGGIGGKVQPVYVVNWPSGGGGGLLGGLLNMGAKWFSNLIGGSDATQNAISQMFSSAAGGNTAMQQFLMGGINATGGQIGGYSTGLGIDQLTGLLQGMGYSFSEGTSGLTQLPIFGSGGGYGRSSDLSLLFGPSNAGGGLFSAIGGGGGGGIGNLLGDFKYPSLASMEATLAENQSWFGKNAPSFANLGGMGAAMLFSHLMKGKMGGVGGALATAGVQTMSKAGIGALLGVKGAMTATSIGTGFGTAGMGILGGWLGGKIGGQTGSIIGNIGGTALGMKLMPILLPKILPFLTNPITAIPAAIALAIYAAFKLKKNSYEKTSKEIGRDFGIKVSDKTIEGFAKGIGLGKKQLEKIRKDVASSPAFIEYLAKKGLSDQEKAQLVQSFSRLQLGPNPTNAALEKYPELQALLVGRTANGSGLFDFSQVVAEALTSGDFSAFNELFTKVFGASGGLAKAFPQWEKLLASVQSATTATDEAVSTAMDNLKAAAATFSTEILVATKDTDFMTSMLGKTYSKVGEIIDTLTTDQLRELTKGLENLQKTMGEKAPASIQAFIDAINAMIAASETAAGKDAGADAGSGQTAGDVAEQVIGGGGGSSARWKPDLGDILKRAKASGLEVGTAGYWKRVYDLVVNDRLWMIQQHGYRDVDLAGFTKLRQWAIENLHKAGGLGGTGTSNIAPPALQHGGYITNGGMALLHSGELVLPKSIVERKSSFLGSLVSGLSGESSRGVGSRQWGNGDSQPVNVTVNINPSFTVTSRSEDLSRTVRDEVWPELEQMLETNARGVADTIARVTKRSSQGVLGGKS